MKRKNRWLILCLAGLLLAGCGGAETAAAPSPEPTAQATATPRPTFTPTPTATPTPEPTATPEPTPAPTPWIRKAQLDENGRVVPAEWGAVIPERAERADDSFFSDACMIGNSLVGGFTYMSGLAGVGKIDCIYETSVTAYGVMKSRYMDMKNMRRDAYSNVYIVLGLNELGNTGESFAECYGELIAFVRQRQPRANIILVSGTPMERWVHESLGNYQTMDMVHELNEVLMDLCVRYNCWYLDLYSILVDQEGFLKEELAYHGDGLHLEANGYELWAEYMRTHYVDQGLLTE